jgi:hypothetical protein
MFFAMGWIAPATYCLVFVLMFFLIVPLYLCRHCPYYAGPGRIVKCPAHYGAVKLFKSTNKRLNPLESFLTVGGLVVLFGGPLVIEAIGGQWFWLAASAWTAVLWIVTMQRYICAVCPNFSCPLNRIDKAGKY